MINLQGINVYKLHHKIESSQFGTNCHTISTKSPTKLPKVLKMSLKVRLLLILYISYLDLGNSAFLKFPDDYTEIVPRQQLPRFKRSLTTICVEIRPSSSQEEPYYMCKGADVPRIKNETPQRTSAQNTFHAQRAAFYPDKIIPRVNLDERDVSKTYNQMGFRGPTEPYPEQGTISQQLRNQFFQFEPEFNAHVPQEQPFLSYAQQEDKAIFNPQYTHSLYENPTPEAPVTPRAYGNDAYSFKLGTQSPYFFDRTNVHQQTTVAPPTSLVQDNLVNPAYYTPFGRNAGIGSLSKKNDLDTRALEEAVLPVNEVFIPGSNLGNPLHFNSYSPHEITDELLNIVNYHNKPALNIELQNLMQPRTIPSEYMDDPILRAFYNTLLDSSVVEKKPYAKAMHDPSVTDIRENKTPIKPIKSQQLRQQEEERPNTALPSQNVCPTCPTTSIQSDVTVARTPSAISEHDLPYRSGNSCPHQDHNWPLLPPLVIAMPCCGQHANAGTLNNISPAQNAFNAPQMAFGFTPNFMIPMTPMTPNWNNMQNNLAITKERTSMSDENDLSAIVTTDMPEVKNAASVTESLSEEVKESIELTTEAVTNVIETTIPADEAKELIDNSNEENSDETNSTTIPSLVTVPNNVTTILGMTETTEIPADLADNKETTQKTFKAMLTRAKLYSELANSSVRVPTVINRRKGKRQNTKETNDAYHNIAAANSAHNYKRQYASMLR